MDNPPEQLSWNSEDTNLLRQFLETRSGSKVVAKLAESAPTLLDGGHANKTLVRCGELRGYQFALREILFLAYPPPAPPVETAAYPDLGDDSAWPNTEKLTPPK